MEVICSSETLADTQWTTRRYIPEDGTLHQLLTIASYNDLSVVHYIHVIFYDLLYTVHLLTPLQFSLKLFCF
jgi:hypothetical protein